jgi:hypothetical protein
MLDLVDVNRFYGGYLQEWLAYITVKSANKNDRIVALPSGTHGLLESSLSYFNASASSFPASHIWLPENSLVANSQYVSPVNVLRDAPCMDYLPIC